mgnify:CR=1
MVTALGLCEELVRCSTKREDVDMVEKSRSRAKNERYAAMVRRSKAGKSVWNAISKEPRSRETQIKQRRCTQSLPPLLLDEVHSTMRS